MVGFKVALGTVSALALAIPTLVVTHAEPKAAAPRLACLTVKPDDKVWIPSGDVIMGSDNFEPEERPVRREHVGGFYIDRHEVSNLQFAAFVAATGYRTLAERAPSWPADTKLTDEMRRPGGIVFRLPEPNEHGDPNSWWRWTAGANWRHPEGPTSEIKGKGDFPVLQIAYPDAVAYAKWRGDALPTEAQWERAARGNHQGRDYVWGDDPYPNGKQMANTWQGVFPLKDVGDDGFTNVAPVGCFPANDFGLYDMAGNVWEWTLDNFGTHEEVVGNVNGQAVSIRGGSWLCAPNFCGRFRPSARQPGDAMVGTTHIGFRTIRLPKVTDKKDSGESAR